jgi:hypothetical protein
MLIDYFGALFEALFWNIFHFFFFFLQRLIKKRSASSASVVIFPHENKAKVAPNF